MINTKIFAYIAKKRQKKYPRRKQFVDYNHAKSVLILYESDLMENRTAIDAMVHQLRGDGKQVTVIGFVPKKVCTSISTASFIMIDKSKINLFAQPKAGVLDLVYESHFDLIIDLTQTCCLPLQYALLYTNASCKVGGRLNPYELIDLVVDIRRTGKCEVAMYGSETTLFAELLHYLKEIKQKA